MTEPSQEYVEVARAATGRGEVVLRERRDQEGRRTLELRVNGVFVMDTAETSSERALATAALELVDAPDSVLVGGLGLGFTVREILADDRVESCTVVEIEQAVVDWMGDGTVPHGPELLADDRLDVRVGDVANVVAETPPAHYDLVLLDVDNGPCQLVHAGNAALYDVPFLRSVRDALRPDGVAVVWSAAESPALTQALAGTFDATETLALPVNLQGREERYWLHLARVASEG